MHIVQEQEAIFNFNNVVVWPSLVYWVYLWAPDFRKAVNVLERKQKTGIVPGMCGLYCMKIWGKVPPYALGAIYNNPLYLEQRRLRGDLVEFKLITIFDSLSCRIRLMLPK